MTSITAEQLRHMIASKQPLSIIDVRPRREFMEHTLEGAKNIMLPYIKDGSHKLSKNITLVLVCGVGAMSELAALHLEQQGYTNVVHLKGGIKVF